MRIACGRAIFAILMFFGVAETADSAVSGLQLVTSNLVSPIYVLSAPGDRDRLFIVENGFPFDGENANASIRIFNLKTGVLEPTPFLTIPGVNSSAEGGLLGMAFHPDYFTTDPNKPGRGKFYVNLTANDTNPDTPFTSYIREYSV